MILENILVQGIWWGMVVGVVLQTIALFMLTVRTNWSAEVNYQLLYIYKCVFSLRCIMRYYIILSRLKSMLWYNVYILMDIIWSKSFRLQKRQTGWSNQRKKTRLIFLKVYEQILLLNSIRILVLGTRKFIYSFLYLFSFLCVFIFLQRPQSEYSSVEISIFWEQICHYCCGTHIAKVIMHFPKHNTVLRSCTLYF